MLEVIRIVLSAIVIAWIAQSPIELRGRVVDATTLEPIRKALVSIRFRAEAYDEEQRSLISSEDTQARLAAGKVILPQAGPVLRNTLRANYAFHLNCSKLTLYTETTNTLGRKNIRYEDLDNIGSGSRVLYRTESLIPFLPAAGITVEF